MKELELTAALAAMGVRMEREDEPFECIAWEWESDLGVYYIDRVDSGYDARYAPRRLEKELSIHTDDGEGPVDWASSARAIRACKQHYSLVRAGMSPSRACAEVLAWSQRPAKTPTLRGLAPVEAPAAPVGAWL